MRSGVGAGGRRGNILSTAVFVVLAVVLALAAVLYYQEQNDESDVEPPPPPSPVGGRYELANIVDVLRDEDLDVDYGQGTVKTQLLTQPGQILTIGDATLYVFLYPDVEARQDNARDLEDADPATLVLTKPSGAEVPTENVVLTQGANVIAALSGGSPDTVEKVTRAIEGLT